MSLSVLHVRAPMYTTAHDACATATRCASPTRRASRRNSRSKSAGVKDATPRAKRPTSTPDGRLVSHVDPDATQEMQLYVTAPKAALTGAAQPITMIATDLAEGESATVDDHFFGP